jgi:beta-glucuronidase
MSASVGPRVGRPLLALIAALAVLIAVVPTVVLAESDEPVALDEGWSFVEDPSDDGLDAGRATGGGEGWEEVGVPHVMLPDPVEENMAGTVGWYRVDFEGPESEDGRGWAVRFGSVRREATVWLNGRRIATHRDPYTPFTVPLDGLRQGEDNTLVVRVDGRKGEEPREGWWNWGGIVRPVELTPLGRVVNEGTAVMSDVSCNDGGEVCDARVLVDGWVHNRSDSPQSPQVDVELRRPDEEGEVAAQGSARAPTIPPGERARVRFEVPVAGPLDLWAPETPDLYGATVETSLGDEVEDVHTQRVGLRQVDVRDGLLHLNGRATKLRGASIQEDVPGRGPALTDEDVERTVSSLKALNANVTRAHYLLDERLLERFDEEGILVWSQAPVYHRDDLLVDPDRRDFELESVRGTVLGGRTHASVITHSVANELDAWPDDVESTGDYLRRAADLTTDLDPTLPASVDILSYPDVEGQEVYDRFDMLGINSYYGWYPGKPERSTANLADLEPYLRSMHEKYPGQGMVITEFGAESTYSGSPEDKETYEFQVEYIRDTLEIVDGLDFMGGAIYWTLREFAVKPNWIGGFPREGVERDGIHRKALITYDGRPKPAWGVTQAMFASTPLYRGGAPRSAVLIDPVDGGPPAWRGLALALGAVALILVLIALDLWCMRDIYRARRDDGDDQRPPSLQPEAVHLHRVA